MKIVRQYDTAAHIALTTGHCGNAQAKTVHGARDGAGDEDGHETGAELGAVPENWTKARHGSSYGAQVRAGNGAENGTRDRAKNGRAKGLSMGLGMRQELAHGIQ